MLLISKILIVIGPLTASELQQLADDLDLDQSDVDDNLLDPLDQDDFVENLIYEKNERQEDILQPDDEFNSSDDEPLARLIPPSSKKCRL